VLAITHYSRLLHELRADVIHILVKGEIRESGGPEMAEALETSGYAQWITEDDVEPPEVDPFADPFGPGPFA